MTLHSWSTLKALIIRATYTVLEGLNSKDKKGPSQEFSRCCPCLKHLLFTSWLADPLSFWSEDRQGLCYFGLVRTFSSLRAEYIQFLNEKSCCNNFEFVLNTLYIDEYYIESQLWYIHG
jgi:hypothetical protein